MAKKPSKAEIEAWKANVEAALAPATPEQRQAAGDQLLEELRAQYWATRVMKCPAIAEQVEKLRRECRDVLGEWPPDAKIATTEETFSWLESMEKWVKQKSQPKPNEGTTPVELAVAVDDDDAVILAVLTIYSPNSEPAQIGRVTINRMMTQTDIEAGTVELRRPLTRRTIGERLRQMESMTPPLVSRPKGERGGWAVTDTGRKAARPQTTH